MNTEGMAGQTPTTESWRTPDGRVAVAYYDERGVAQVTRELLTGLLTAAGYELITEGDQA